jgi:hypothetical protein
MASEAANAVLPEDVLRYILEIGTAECRCCAAEGVKTQLWVADRCEFCEDPICPLHTVHLPTWNSHQAAANQEPSSKTTLSCSDCSDLSSREEGWRCRHTSCPHCTPDFPCRPTSELEAEQRFWKRELCDEYTSSEGEGWNLTYTDYDTDTDY